MEKHKLLFSRFITKDTQMILGHSVNLSKQRINFFKLEEFQHIHPCSLGIQRFKLYSLYFAKANEADYFFSIKLKELEKDRKRTPFGGCMEWRHLIAIISKYMHFLLKYFEYSLT